jgi:uncharacterized peroxidase-related enzyme
MRLPIPTRDELPAYAEEAAAELIKNVGFVPELHRALAMSPAVLTGFRAMQKASGDMLDLKTRLKIAIAVSEKNGCAYCVRAHSFSAMNHANVSPEDVEIARRGLATSPRDHAAIVFSLRVLEAVGSISNDDLANARSAGFADAEVIEIIALVAQFTFTNLVNNVLATEPDFPAMNVTEAA